MRHLGPGADVMLELPSAGTASVRCRSTLISTWLSVQAVNPGMHLAEQHLARLLRLAPAIPVIVMPWQFVVRSSAALDNIRSKL